MRIDYIKYLAGKALRIKSFWQKELSLKFKVSLSKRIFCLGNGFLSESFVIYSLDKNSIHDYVSDYDKIVRTCDIDGPFRTILGNKLLFNTVLLKHSQHLPKLYSMIISGQIIALKENHITNFDDLKEYCSKTNGLVLKPISGGGGGGIFIITFHNGTFLLNGQGIDEKILHDKVGKLSGYIISEKIKQSDYAHKIYPGSVNTIRLITMWDYKNNSPFIAAAVHRFGSSKSGHLDNWCQGGCSSLINLESGTLGPAISYPHNGFVEENSCHPDTSSRITGVQIPNWDSLKNDILKISSGMPFLPYCGWDLVLDSGNRMKIIEGNHYPDLNLVQIHRPLLKIPKVKEFYLHHGIGK